MIPRVADPDKIGRKGGEELFRKTLALSKKEDVP